MGKTRSRLSLKVSKKGFVIQERKGRKENTLQKKAGKLAYLARTTPKTNGLRSTFEEKRENRDFYSLSKPLCQHFFSATVSKMFSPVGTKPPFFGFGSRSRKPFLFPFLFAIAEGQKRH